MKKFNSCEEAQNTADAICNGGSTGFGGTLGGFEELSKGISCLMAQKRADKICKSENKKQMIKNYKITTNYVKNMAIEYLEPVKRIIFGEMFSRPKNDISMIDKVTLKHPMTSQFYVLEIPQSVQQVVLKMAKLTKYGNEITDWLKTNNDMTLYNKKYDGFDENFKKSNSKCKMLLNDNGLIEHFKKENNGLTQSYPKDFFNVANMEGYSKNTRLPSGISINYSVMCQVNMGGDIGGGKKFGGWEIVGVALMTFTIPIGGGGGGSCSIL